MAKNGLCARENAVRVLDSVVDSMVERNSARGLFGRTAAEVSELERRQFRARMENPFSYTIGDVLSSADGYRYRTGFDGTVSYFSVDDFCRLRRERGNGKSGALLPSRMVETYTADSRMMAVQRPAAAYRGGEAAAPAMLSGTGEVFFANGESELKVSDNSRAPLRLWSKIRKATEEAPLIVMTRTSRRHVSGAVAAVSLALICTVLLALPVTLKILIHNESAEIAKLDKQIRAAEAEATQLEIALDRKNDRALLEALATETYGMVRLDRSDFSVLSIHPEDAIEVHEKEKSGGAVPALLKALGLRAGD